MKKYLKNVAIILMMAALFPVRASAAETSDIPEIIYMTEEEAEYYAELYLSDDGIVPYSSFTEVALTIQKEEDRILVLYSTSVYKAASEVGIKKVMLEEKNGLTWSALVKYDKEYRKNAYTYVGGFYFTAPTSGSTYRASGIHFAVLDGEEITRYASTGGYKYE